MALSTKRIMTNVRNSSWAGVQGEEGGELELPARHDWAPGHQDSVGVGSSGTPEGNFGEVVSRWQGNDGQAEVLE